MPFTERSTCSLSTCIEKCWENGPQNSNNCEQKELGCYLFLVCILQLCTKGRYIILYHKCKIHLLAIFPSIIILTNPTG